MSKVSDSWIRINVKEHDNLHHIDFNREKLKFREAEKAGGKEKDKKGAVTKM